MIEQDQYRSPNVLKFATQSIDFSSGRMDSFGALDTEKKIAKYISRICPASSASQSYFDSHL